ncbi:hypothetical protein THII_1120 [Thioploca ingrica]|uniref:UspA domain-containing protein n=1 Tax=Thioploca ingrica TaxID=40754 RepID=A0A090AIW5_9GAMM|nr:hypothetical protein THII_1120 [Thioploca ingrica]
MRKVLLAVKENELPEYMLHYASNLCQRIEAGLDVLWIATNQPIPQILTNFLKNTRQIPCQLIQCSGEPAVEIQRYVYSDQHIVMIVMHSMETWQGSNPRFWEKLPCPVVVVNQVPK